MITYDELARHLEHALFPIVVAIPRLLTAFSVVPVLATQAIPVTVRIAFSLSLALFLYPLHSTALLTDQISPLVWLCIVLKEILIGFCLGFVCSIFIWVLEGVGSLIDTVVGNNNLFLFNPMLNQESGPFSNLLGQVGAMLFISFGGLILLLKTMFSSFVMWPVISYFPTWSDKSRVFLISQSSSVIATSLQLAMPILTVLMLVDLGLGLLNRTASQLNAYTLSLPIKAIVSTLFLALTLVFFGDPQGPLLRLMDIGGAFLRLLL